MFDTLLGQSKILEQLGEGKAGIDLVVDAGPLPARPDRAGKPSTVVDLTGSKPKILREGAISSSEISQILGQKL